MRPFLAIMVWVVLIGGLYGYMEHREPATKAGPVETHLVKESYSVEIIPTFKAEKDPFALRSDDNKVEVLTLKLNGKKIFGASEGIERGVPVKVEDIDNIIKGMNEFHVEASPRAASGPKAHAVRFRLFKGLTPVLERTIWSDPGEKVSAAIHYDHNNKKENGNGYDH